MGRPVVVANAHRPRCANVSELHSTFPNIIELFHACGRQNFEKGRSNSASRPHPSNRGHPKPLNPEPLNPKPLNSKLKDPAYQAIFETDASFASLEFRV